MEDVLAQHLEEARLIAMNRTPYWETEIAGMTWTQSTEEVESEYAAMGLEFTMGVTSDWQGMVSSKITGLWETRETATVVLHEMMHLWQNHHARFKAMMISSQEDLLDWMRAVDFEINDDLRDAKFPFPKTHPGVFPQDEGFPKGLLAEEYFKLLRARRAGRQQQGQGTKQQQGQGTKQQQGQGTKQQAPGQGQECGSAAGPAGLAEELMDLPNPARGPDELAEILSEMSAAAESYAASHPGKVPGGIVKDAKRFRHRSEIDWRSQLSSSVRSAVAGWRQGQGSTWWGRFSRRQVPGSRILLPSHRQARPLVAIVRDTSASMTELLSAMYPEIDAVLQATRAEIIVFDADAAAYAPVRVKHVQALEKIGFKGGGGTDFRPAFKAISDMPKKTRPGILIYITDGYGKAPEHAPSGLKVVWAMLGGKKPPATWGNVVHIKP